MTSLTVAGSAWLFSKGAVVEGAHCDAGTAVLGYNRRRDLVWDVVHSHQFLGEEDYLRVWTARGDCPILPSAQLSTTHGAIAASHLANLIGNGEEVRVELPHLGSVPGLRADASNSSSAAIVDQRVLPFQCAGKPIVRAHISTRERLDEILCPTRTSAKKQPLNAAWCWLALDRVPALAPPRQHPLCPINFELADLLTRIPGEKHHEWRTFSEESLLRLLQQLNLILSNKPFEASVFPKLNPLEITLSPCTSWHPYARTLAVTRIRDAAVRLEFATPSFTPIVNNFMLLS